MNRGKKMNYFNFIGAVIACILAMLKIKEIINNRPIIKVAGIGSYYYKNEPFLDFSYLFENLKHSFINKIVQKEKTLRVRMAFSTFLTLTI
jgi:hypothetical protein